MKIYLDTAPAIYLVEGVPKLSNVVSDKLSAAETTVITSSLTKLECRVAPLRNNDSELLKDYDEFFANIVHEMVSLSNSIMDRATEIRAHYGFKTPDAIHLAAAVHAECDLFLTNDQRLTQFADLSVELVQPDNTA